MLNELTKKGVVKTTYLHGCNDIQGVKLLKVYAPSHFQGGEFPKEPGQAL